MFSTQKEPIMSHIESIAAALTAHGWDTTDLEKWDSAIKVFDMLSSAGDLRERVKENTRYFREQMTQASFDIKPGVHPIVPVMVYDAKKAQAMATELLEEGIYVTGFFYPVVPQGQARIRTQMSAAHTREHLDQAIAAFTKVGRKLGVIG